MTTLNEASIGDVRCFWVDSGRPTLAASLLFRCGMADEPLSESGWFHIIEHLALHGRGGGTLHVNGSVSPLVTSFDAHGPSDQVASHLSRVTEWLSDPDFTELEREKRVLRAEANTRGGPGARAFGWRYGARGPGVIAMGEAGLGMATAERLAERTRQWFTTGNSVLVLDGPPPPGLQLTLPTGGLSGASRAVPCEEALPAGYVDEAGLVLSGVVPRSGPATFLPPLLERALRREFRELAGGSYAPWSAYEPVDDDHALILAASDVSDDLLPTLAPTTLDLVHRLAEDGPDDEGLAEAVDARLQAATDPYNRAMIAFRAANFFLGGRSPQTFDEMVEELRSTTSDDVRQDARSFYQSLLLGVPGATNWEGILPLISEPRKQGRVTGERFRHQNWPAEQSFLVVDEGDAHHVFQEAYACYHADDVEGMHVFEDGGRHLITREGWGITVNPGEWRNGDRLVAALDRMVPEERHLPHPARSQPVVGSRLPLLPRLWHGREALIQTTGFIILLGVLGLAAAIMAIALVSTFVGIAIATLTVGIGQAWFENHRKRVYRGK